MKLIEFKICGFKGYEEEQSIKLDNLIAIVGKNDAGKSTIFEAMDIFFNTEKVEKNDIHKNTENVVLTAVFDSKDETGLEKQKVIIDESNETTLGDEYLLNSDKKLEIKKIFKGGSNKKEIFIVAEHPKDELLSKKVTELKEDAKDLDIKDDKRKSASYRKALREKYGVELKKQDIKLDKEDGKKIYENLKKSLPRFALFKVDRDSTDQNSEIKDPVNTVLECEIEQIKDKFEELKKELQDKIEDLGKKTVEELKNINKDLASELKPHIKSDWKKALSFSFTGENDIPINKRGSGTRRLILLGFFKANAKRNERNENIIYAIEEPETSQHPNHQKMIVDSFKRLSEDGNQIFFTTHNPQMIRGEVDYENIRYIKDKEITNKLDFSEFREMSESLGTFKTIKLFIVVEGKTDETFYKKMSKIISENNKKVLNFEDEEKKGTLVFTIAYGCKNLDISKELTKNSDTEAIIICDGDSKVNASDDEKIFKLKRKEIENYIDYTVINECLGKELEKNYTENYEENKKEDKEVPLEKSEKKPLHKCCYEHITYEKYLNVDGNKEIENMLEEISEKYL